MTGLYTKGLIYIDVPIADDDFIVGKNWSAVRNALIVNIGNCIAVHAVNYVAVGLFTHHMPIILKVKACKMYVTAALPCF